MATGFPAGLTPLEQRLGEIRFAVAAGAAEIDVVITRGHVFSADWQALYDELRAMREACGPAHMKAILATGELETLTNVYRASMVAHDGRRRFHKDLDRQGRLSTRRCRSALVMVPGASATMASSPGNKVGFKPAGGLRSAKDAMAWLILMKEELGDALDCSPDLFRLGASSLLGDIERQLEHYVTGRYSAANRHAMA